MSRANFFDLVLISALAGLIWWGYYTYKHPLAALEVEVPAIELNLEKSIYYKSWDFKHCTPTNTDCGRLDEKSN